MAAMVPTGSHFWVKNFTMALQLLRTSFQEMLGLYDQVSISQKWGETPAPIHSVSGGRGEASPLSDDQQLMYFGHVCGVGPPKTRHWRLISEPRCRGSILTSQQRIGVTMGPLSCR